MNKAAHSLRPSVQISCTTRHPQFCGIVGWLLTKFFLEITFAFDWVELVVISIGVIILTVTIGWLNSREVINTPPLQVLRKEA